MDSRIVLSRRGAGGAGYGDDLPLSHELKGRIALDASGLEDVHPMLLVRMGMFLDWHRSAGRDVDLVPPAASAMAQRLADMGLGHGRPQDAMRLPGPNHESAADYRLRRLMTANDVEDAASAAVEMLGEQLPALAVWGDPVHMAVSELCDNALQHGKDELGAYVAADRIEGDRRSFRLAIADLGIGIPEHIRSCHPEWQDDTAAIARALQRGVTGTGDDYRGNGFEEVFDDALHLQLKRESSSVTVDIRSAHGRVIVDLIDGQRRVQAGTVSRSRRGTWITYTVTSI